MVKLHGKKNILKTSFLMITNNLYITIAKFANAAYSLFDQ